MIQLITFCSSNGATKEPGFLQWDAVLFLLRTCKTRQSRGNVAVIKRRNRFQVASGELQQVLGHRVLFYFLHLGNKKRNRMFPSVLVLFLFVLGINNLSCHAKGAVCNCNDLKVDCSFCKLTLFHLSKESWIATCFNHWQLHVKLSSSYQFRTMQIFFLTNLYFFFLSWSFEASLSSYREPVNSKLFCHEDCKYFLCQK